MDQVQTKTTSLEAATKEHLALRGTLRDLGQFLEENPLTSDAPGSSMAARLLRAQLSTLFVTLERHFREEEESGLPEILRMGPPQIEDCVAELRLQHARILSELRALTPPRRGSRTRDRPSTFTFGSGRTRSWSTCPGTRSRRASNSTASTGRRRRRRRRRTSNGAPETVTGRDVQPRGTGGRSVPMCAKSARAFSDHATPAPGLEPSQ